MLANDCDGLPLQEMVRVTFDDKPGFSGKASKMYGQLMTSDAEYLYYRNRLHPDLSFGDSLTIPGIQAADMLAFEAKKYCESRLRNEPMRWQLARLHGSGKVRVKLWDPNLRSGSWM
jgi:hypothetical protein